MVAATQRASAPWTARGCAWDAARPADPRRPPDGWAWRDNPARPGAGHRYDVGDLLRACGAFRAPSLCHNFPSSVAKSSGVISTSGLLCKTQAY